MKHRYIFFVSIVIIFSMRASCLCDNRAERLLENSFIFFPFLPLDIQTHILDYVYHVIITDIKPIMVRESVLKNYIHYSQQRLNYEMHKNKDGQEAQLFKSITQYEFSLNKKYLCFKEMIINDVQKNLSVVDYIFCIVPRNNKLSVSVIKQYALSDLVLHYSLLRNSLVRSFAVSNDGKKIGLLIQTDTYYPTVSDYYRKQYVVGVFCIDDELMYISHQFDSTEKNYLCINFNKSGNYLGCTIGQKHAIYMVPIVKPLTQSYSMKDFLIDNHIIKRAIKPQYSFTDYYPQRSLCSVI